MVQLIVTSVGYSTVMVEGLHQLKKVMTSREYMELKRKLGFVGADSEDLPKVHEYLYYFNNGVKDVLNILIDHQFDIASKGGQGGYGPYYNTWILERWTERERA